MSDDGVRIQERPGGKVVNIEKHEYWLILEHKLVRETGYLYPETGHIWFPGIMTTIHKDGVYENRGEAQIALEKDLREHIIHLQFILATTKEDLRELLAVRR